jgi:hypothetical protein
MSVNPYEMPKSDVNETATGDQSSLENAVAGRYDFSIEEVLREAWRLVDGFKLTFWGAAIVVILAMGLVMGVLGIPLSRMGGFGRVLLQISSNALNFVLGIGLTMLAVRRAAERPVRIGDAFNHFDIWLPALLAGMLVGVFATIGFMLLVLPGIYLAVAYIMTMPLIGDRRLGAWDAMEISRKAITRKWWKVFATGLIAFLIVVVTGLLIVPLFWTVPWLVLVSAVLYKRIFGVASAA